MKRADVFSILLLFAVCFSVTVTAFLPFAARFGNLWDSLVNPLKVLTQIPAPIALARIDWKVTPAAHVFTVDVPGMKKDEIRIEVKKRVLTISGEPSKEEEKKNEKSQRVERAAGKFWRQFRLPANVDMDAITADLENGVLTVTAPKVRNDKAKTFEFVEIVENGNVKIVL